MQRWFLAAALVSVLTARPTAHHSFGVAFDASKPVTLVRSGDQDRLAQSPQPRLR